MVTSWRTTSATRRSRTVLPAVSTAARAAASQDSLLTPITSVTRYTLSAMWDSSRSGAAKPTGSTTRSAAGPRSAQRGVEVRGLAGDGRPGEALDRPGAAGAAHLAGAAGVGDQRVDALGE